MDPGRDAGLEYGSYLSAICMGYHSASLTNKFDEWSQDDFFRMMQTGALPDGGQIGPGMSLYSEMHDTELIALWLYFRSLQTVKLQE